MILTWPGWWRGWRALLQLMGEWAGASRPSEAELVRVAMTPGDRGRHAYDTLVDRYSGPVFRQLFRLLRDRGLADDASQETFIKGYLELPKLRDPSAFGPWIKRIATRTAFNLRRDRSTQEDYEERAHVHRSAMSEGPSSPEARSIATESVWLTLGKLSYPYREILVLRYLEELSVQEIATHLDLGLSAAKMRLKRARGAFQEAYQRSVTPPPA